LDIFCDDPKVGTFRVLLVSRRRRFLWDSTANTTELETLCGIVAAELRAWAGEISVIEVNDKFLPVG